MLTLLYNANQPSMNYLYTHAHTNTHTHTQKKNDKKKGNVIPYIRTIYSLREGKLGLGTCARLGPS